MNKDLLEKRWYFSHNNKTGEFTAIEPDGTFHLLDINPDGEPKTTGTKFSKLFNRMIEDLSKNNPLV